MTRILARVLCLIIGLVCLAPLVVPARADQAFVSFIQSRLWPEARAAGIRREVFEAAFAGITEPDPVVMQMAGNQPELTSTTSQYLFKVVNPTRIAEGQKALAANRQLLREIGARYGVEPRVVLAIWGIESNYGGDIGGMSVVRSLATLAYQGRRQDYGRQQLIAALRIVQSGVVRPASFTGSWAGALGHTQFIPTSYLAFAVDWTGDGRRDIWQSPADALASTANYLAKAGWQEGVPWGVEVKVPADLDRGLIGRKVWKSFAEWTKLGLAPARGGAFAGRDAKAFLMYPQGLAGPGFLVTRNFLAIMDYNQSHSYALAVGYLADRIGGAEPLLGPWPDGVVELTGPERVEMQQRLTRAGFDTGGSDGRFGARTYEAILSFQRARGLVLDGNPSRALLAALRRES